MARARLAALTVCLGPLPHDPVTLGPYLATGFPFSEPQHISENSSWPGKMFWREIMMRERQSLNTSFC